jgi:drug/metabolite transporter (DMT)-like permease
MTRASLRGALYGLTAAACFGVSTPVAKLLLGSMAPPMLAGLLYLGAGIALTAYRLVRRASQEAPLRAADLKFLLPMIAAGGVIAPLLMLFGLNEVGPMTGSLLLNLEAPFTMLLALVFFGEHMGRRALLASALILSAAVVLRVESGALTGELSGVILIALACGFWGLDNNLTQRLSMRDPLSIVQAKTLAAGTTNLLLAFGTGAELPKAPALATALAIGAVSYGLSVLLDAYALRWVGAAREAAFMATAPFMGVLGSAALFRVYPSPVESFALATMLGGVALLMRDKHSHRHRHEALEHEHVHEHDQHHRHAHAPGDPPGEPHSHPHRHEEAEHSHPHSPDLHHRHRH